MIELVNAFIKTLKDENALSTKELADNHYSVRELYEHRLTLFKLICHSYPSLAWKTKCHADGTMFNDSFLAGINTPTGVASYHFKMTNFDEFEIKEIEQGPPYDGYTPEDVLKRINSLPKFERNYILPKQTDNGIVNGRGTSVAEKNYIETDKTIIYNPIEEISSDLQQIITDDKNAEKIKKLTDCLNEAFLLLKELNLIKSVDISDGNHTIKELYQQKRELFKFLCHNYKDLSWKSECYSDGSPAPKDTFLAGINTPLGATCYVLNKEHYDSFSIQALSKAPISSDDVYTDVLKKLSSLKIRQFEKQNKAENNITPRAK